MTDDERPVRPRAIHEDKELELLNNVRKARAGREKSNEVITYEAGISQSNALPILHKHGLFSVKPT